MDKITVSLLIWERLVLGKVVGSLPAGSATIGSLRQGQKIMGILELTEDEKREAKFRIDSYGNSHWGAVEPKPIDFTFADHEFLKKAVAAYDSWPSGDALASSLALAEKFGL